MTEFAKWPESEHIAPIAVDAGDGRVRINGMPPRFPVRVITEDEYQLLLAGFIEAGGKVQK